jgi:hypothetical protein
VPPAPTDDDYALRHAISRHGLVLEAVETLTKSVPT